jgi:transcriptional repressor NrdR
MVCIYCSDRTQVTNSRHNTGTNEVWRRRHCLRCQAIFTTYETADLTNSFVVKYSSKDLRHFTRELLFLSIYESCKHRDDAVAAAKTLTSTITSFLVKQSNQESGIIERETLVRTCQEVIERFDPAAASVYKAYHRI